jgi:hypothetical protein
VFFPLGPDTLPGMLSQFGKITDIHLNFLENSTLENLPFHWRNRWRSYINAQ